MRTSPGAGHVNRPRSLVGGQKASAEMTFLATIFATSMSACNAERAATIADPFRQYN
jgi:hypothetical protein